MRIAAKKARYATEFFQSSHSAGRVKRYLRRLAALQNALGWLNLETAVGVAKARQVADAPEDSGRLSDNHLELLRSSSNLPQSRANARFLPFGTPGNCGF